jgi:hypothetical protein
MLQNKISKSLLKRVLHRIFYDNLSIGVLDVKYNVGFYTILENSEEWYVEFRGDYFEDKDFYSFVSEISAILLEDTYFSVQKVDSIKMGDKGPKENFVFVGVSLLKESVGSRQLVMHDLLDNPVKDLYSWDSLLLNSFPKYIKSITQLSDCWTNLVKIGSSNMGIETIQSKPQDSLGVDSVDD